MLFIVAGLSNCSVFINPAPTRAGQALRDVGITETVMLVASLSREQVHACVVSLTPQALDARDQAVSTLAAAESTLTLAASFIDTSPDQEAAFLQYQAALFSRDSAKATLDAANDSIVLAVSDCLDSAARSTLAAVRTTSKRDVSAEYWTLAMDDSEWETVQAALAWQATQAPEVTQLRDDSSEQIAESLEVEVFQHESDSYASTLQAVANDPGVTAARTRLTVRMAETRTIFDTGTLPP
jgi:hypothetical protein